MKNILTLCMATGLILLFACRNPNDPLLKKIDAAKISYQKSFEGLERLPHLIDSTMASTELADTNFQKTAVWVSLRESLQGMRSKLGIIQADYKSVAEKLDKLRSDYDNSKRSAEAAQAEYELLLKSVDGYAAIEHAYQGEYRDYANFYKAAAEEFALHPDAFELNKPAPTPQIKQH